MNYIYIVTLSYFFSLDRKCKYTDKHICELIYV